MRTSIFQSVALLLAASVQAAPQPQGAAPPAATIPPPCQPIVPAPDLPATYDRWFEFQEAYLFKKDLVATFGFFSEDFNSTWRRGVMNRDEFWAQPPIQQWPTVPSYPTGASFRDNVGYVSYDLGVNRTGHAGDRFVWENGCIKEHRQTV